jgi:hypothetical protein
VPIFVVTHEPPRVPPKQDERLTFTFVTDGIESAIAQARTAAGGKAVTVIDGASVIHQLLRAGLGTSSGSTSCRCWSEPACGCLRTSILSGSNSRRSAWARSEGEPASDSGSRDSRPAGQLNCRPLRR